MAPASCLLASLSLSSPDIARHCKIAYVTHVIADIRVPTGVCQQWAWVGGWEDWEGCKRWSRVFVGSCVQTGAA